MSLLSLALASSPAEARAWRTFTDDAGGDVFITEAGYAAGTSLWADTLTGTTLEHELQTLLGLSEEGWLVGTDVHGAWVVWQEGTPTELEAPPSWEPFPLAIGGGYLVGHIHDTKGYDTIAAAWDLSDGSIVYLSGVPDASQPSEVSADAIAAGDVVDGGSRSMFLWDIPSSTATTITPSFAMHALEGAAWSASGLVALQPNQRDSGPPYTTCVWDGATLTTLTTAGSWGLGIDDAGRVAYDQGGSLGAGVHLWEAGADMLLGSLAAGDTNLVGMSADGLVFVAETPTSGGDTLLWTYDPDTGAYTDVGASTGVVPYLPAVAPNGLAAFFDTAVGASEVHLWDPATGELYTLGLSGEGWYGEALAVNSEGLVAGRYEADAGGPESAFFAVPCADADEDGVCDDDEASCAVLLSYPASGADLTAEGRFAWNGDCSGYWLELSPSPDFPAHDTLYSAQLGVAPGMQSMVFAAEAWPNIARRFVNGGYARVRGSSGDGVATSEVISFDTNRVPVSFPTPVASCDVTTISPADGVELSGEPTFRWSTTCTAARLEFSSDPTFPLEATLPIGAVPGSRTTLSASRWGSVTTLLPSGGYWRVVAGASDGEHATEAVAFTVP